MGKIYRLFTVLLIGLNIVSGYCNEKEGLFNEEIPNDYDIRNFLPFKMAIPEHFILRQLNGSDWLLFGDKDILTNLDNQFIKNPESPIFPLSGIIRMKLSCNVAQIGPKTFSGSNDEIIKEIKKMGGKKLVIRELAWGEYPLTIVEATIKEIPFRMGWIGLNCGGPVICVNYMFPQGKKSYQDDLDIWNRFVNETKGLSQAEWVKETELIRK